MRKKQSKKQVNYNKLLAETRVSQVNPFDIPIILSAINSMKRTPSWKSKTTKHQKKTSQGHNNGQCRPQQELTMNEKKIDQLFSNCKRKKCPILIQEDAISSSKDFARSVRFFAKDLFGDQLLGGLPPIGQSHHESIVSMLFDQQIPPDLTEEFKKQYLVGKVIGKGAYAQVRQAFYMPDNRKVAIKVYEKSFLKRQDRKEKVIRQIRILEKLDHPNIVKILDVKETNNHLNIVMEYIEGQLLSSFIKSQKTLSEKRAKPIILSIAAALEYIHSRQISHRDKLDNIILDQHQHPKLIDFGFSTCIQANEKVSLFCGTRNFMAPEIINKQEHRGECADIWALGVVMFIALSGQYPFKGKTDEQLFNKIKSANYPKIHVSREAANLLSLMLAVEPAQRITASGILAHPWLKEGTVNSKKSTARKGTRQKNSNRSLSVRKSKKDENLLPKKDKRLTETCDNFKNVFQEATYSRQKMNKTVICKKVNKQNDNQKFEKKVTSIR